MAIATALTAGEMFNSIGPAYEEAFSGLNTQLDSIKWVQTQIQDLKPAKVLDLGCGTGRPVCAIFADAGHDVLGIDISEVMIKYAREKVPNARFMIADTFNMDLPANTYDVITVHYSLAAGTSQDQIRRQIARMYSWLKVDGILSLATVPGSTNESPDTFMGRPYTRSNLSTEEYLTCLQDVGFQIVHHGLSTFTPKGVEAGICGADDVKEEIHLSVYAVKRWS